MIKVLKMVLSIGIRIGIIEKLFICNQEIWHSKFKFYWSSKEKKELSVMTTIRKNLENKIVNNYKTDFVYYFYLILLKPANQICKKIPKKT